MIPISPFYTSENNNAFHTPVFRVKFASQYRACVMIDMPSGYWRLGESSGTSAADETANALAGTYVGSPTLGLAGAIVRDPNTAVLLTGSQYVTLPNNALLHPGDVFTIEAWVRLLYRGQAHVVLDSAAANDYKLWIDTGGTLKIDKRGVATIAAATQAIPLNEWTHVAVTKSGSSVHLYVNSRDVTGTVTNQTIVTGSAVPTIGTDAVNFTLGAIDEVALYGTALAAGRFAARYNAAKWFLTTEFSSAPIKSNYADEVLSDGPGGYWKFGDIATTTAVDSSGNGFPGTYQNAPALGTMGSLTGDANSAVTLNGSSQYVSVAVTASNYPLLHPGDEFTLEAWIYLSASKAQVIIDSGSNNDYIFSVNSSNDLVLAKRGVANIVASSAAISLNAWTHVVATKNGSSVHLYINGVDVTGSVSNQTIASVNATVHIGTDLTSYLGGSMDEVAIYSQALSAARVMAHYQTGKLLFFRSNVSAVMQYSKWAASQATPDRGQISVGQLQFALTDVADYVSEVMADSPSAFWRLNELSGIMAVDLSLNALTGYWTGGPQLGQTGPITSLSQQPDWGAGLNGAQNMASAASGTLLDPGDVFTIEAWVNFTSVSSKQYILDKGHTGGNGYALFLSATGKITLSSNAGDICAATSTLTANAWHHVLVAKNGATVHIYVDAVDVTGVTSNHTITATTDALTVGSTVAGATYMTGSIADVAIYSTALTIDRALIHLQASQKRSTTGFGTQQTTVASSYRVRPNPSPYRVRPNPSPYRVRPVSFALQQAVTLTRGSSDAVTLMLMTNLLGTGANINTSVENVAVTFSAGYDLITEANYIQLPAGVVDTYITPTQYDLGGYEFTVSDPGTIINKNVFSVASSQLQSGINSSVTSLTVADASQFLSGADPFPGTVYIKVDNEIMSYASITTNTFNTLGRGALGTTAASHSSGASVQELIRIGPSHPIDVVKSTLTATNKCGVGMSASLIADMTALKNAIGATYQMDWRITSVINLKTWLETQIYQVLGLYPITTAGKYNLHQIAVPASTIATLADSDILSDTNKAPMVTFDRNFRQGPVINQITWQYDYDSVAAQYLSSYTYPTTPSASVTAYSSNPVTLQAAGIRTGLAGTPAMMTAAGAQITGRFQSSVPIVTARVFLDKNILEVGDVVLLSASVLPSRATKTRGLANAIMEIVSRAIDFEQGYCDLTMHWLAY